MKSQRQIRQKAYITQLVQKNQKSFYNNISQNQEKQFSQNNNLQIIPGINNNSKAPGRFANHFIRDLACSFIASNSNIDFTYGPYQEKIERLGLILFKPQQTCVFTENILLDDSTFFQYIQKPVEKNFSLEQSFCQTKEFSNFMYNYLRTPSIKNTIITSNNFQERYNFNNDVFIHVRLGDVTGIQKENHDFEYYDKILSTLHFDTGYISSDSLHDELCVKLIEKYNLLTFQSDEVFTIMFASTCKHLILSGGTFSWLMGILAFYSDVYYKTCKIPWFPQEFFEIPDWRKQE